MIRSALAFSAMASMSFTPATAQISQYSCFNKSEFQDVMLIMAPGLLTVMGRQCAPVLPTGMVLGNPDSILFKTANVAGRSAWPRAYTAILRVMQSQGEQLATGDNNLTYEKFVDGVQPLFGRIIKNAESCGHIDKILKLSEPLPIDNLAGILFEVIELMPEAKADIPICH